MVLTPKVSQKSQGWIPVSESSSQEEVVFRLVRGILNKITPEKFDTLVQQLLQLEIQDEQTLRGIIKLIFEKALDEPHFSSLYSQVCAHLSRKKFGFDLPDLHGRQDTPVFIKLLLASCQDEFESRTRLCAVLAEKRSQNEEEYLQARKKMLGNIRFIGELGKLELVSERILHNCIKQLLIRVQNPFPEDLECLCGLLRVVGKRLDHEKAKAHMDAYFGRMQEIMQESLPSRIRFMLQDIMDLRGDRWKPRHGIENGPRKIQDIRMDAQRDAQTKAGVKGSPRTARSDKTGNPDLQADAHYSEQANPGEYSALGKNLRAQPLSADTVARMGNMPKFAVGEEISLRPNAGRNGAASPEIQGSARRATGKKKSEWTSEQLSRHCEGLVEELLSNQDVANAVQCVQEVPAPALVPMVVERTINVMLDRKDGDRALATTFLLELHKSQLLDSSKLLAALRPVLLALPDLTIDAPLAPQYLAALCAQFVCAGVLTLADLFQPPSPPLEANFCAQTLKDVRTVLGDDKLKELYDAARLDLLRLAPACDLPQAQQEELLTKWDLKFLYPALRVKQLIGAMLAEHVKRGSELVPGTRTFAKQLKEKLQAETTTVPKFSGTLATAIFEYVAGLTTLRDGPSHAATKEDRDAEKEMCTCLLPVLARYTTDNVDAQVDVIHALQVFCNANRFPKGLILRVAMYLYDMDVVEEEAWMRWREDISDEYPGKPVALVDLNEYLNWMETAESESEDE